MASGLESLRLTRQITWEEFGRYADALIGMLDGQVDGKADSPVERVWSVTIQGAAFAMAFDDFGLGVSLDPKDEDGARLIPRIRNTLLRVRGQ